MSDFMCDLVTGALSYSGRYIAARLLAQGRRVRTFTHHPERANPFGERVEVRPYLFDDEAELERELAGIETVYNTYWVRFDYGGTTFAQAVENTKRLMRAAHAAGVRRIIHVSIANPERRPDLPYYRGKAELETYLAGSGLSYAILRPTVVFGREDILINNIAWLLRHVPVFLVPGDGRYRVQPISVEDLAELAVGLGASGEEVTRDAVGPEVYTFDELVRAIGVAIGRPARLWHVSPGLALAAAQVIGRAVGDVILTSDEVRGLMADLLVSSGPATSRTKLSGWMRDNAATLGRAYASEVGRHFRSK